MNPLGPLVDRHGRKHDYLRVSLTDRCNFRCQYCMPAEGVEWRPKNEILSLEEIEKLIQLFVSLGISKVRLTGGEPTIRKGYLGLVQNLAPLVPIYLTTNGSTLTRDALQLKSHGLSGINLSCDSLDRQKFAEITRRDELPLVLNGLRAAVDSGIPLKVNVVVMRGFNEMEIPGFVEFALENNIQVRFIEFMPFLGNQWERDLVVPFREIFSLAASCFNLTPVEGQTTDVATEFSVGNSKEPLVGFVSSVTESFCSGCNRLRLTAEGRFKTCLFLPPRTSLRDMVRAGASDEMMVQAIREDLLTKWKEHPSMDRWTQMDTLSMVEIGG